MIVRARTQPKSPPDLGVQSVPNSVEFLIFFEFCGASSVQNSTPLMLVGVLRLRDHRVTPHRPTQTNHPTRRYVTEQRKQHGYSSVSTGASGKTQLNRIITNEDEIYQGIDEDALAYRNRVLRLLDAASESEGDLDLVRKIETHLHALQQMKSKFILSTLINAYVACNSRTDAERIFTTLQNEFAPTPKMFHAIINCELRSGDIDSALHLRSMMKTKWNLHPDPYTYSDFLEYYISSNRLDDAFDFMRKESADESPPGRIPWVKLLFAAGKAGRTDLQQKILDSVKHVKFEPRDWNIVLENFAKSKRVPEVQVSS